MLVKRIRLIVVVTWMVGWLLDHMLPPFTVSGWVLQTCPLWQPLTFYWLYWCHLSYISSSVIAGHGISHLIINPVLTRPKRLHSFLIMYSCMVHCDPTTHDKINISFAMNNTKAHVNREDKPCIHMYFSHSKQHIYFTEFDRRVYTSLLLSDVDMNLKLKARNWK